MKKLNQSQQISIIVTCLLVAGVVSAMSYASGRPPKPLPVEGVWELDRTALAKSLPYMPIKPPADILLKGIQVTISGETVEIQVGAATVKDTAKMEYGTPQEVNLSLATEVKPYGKTLSFILSEPQADGLPRLTFTASAITVPLVKKS